MFKYYQDILKQMEKDMQRIDPLHNFFEVQDRLWEPLVDVHETAEALIVKVEIAGVSPHNMQITLDSDDNLIIRGVRLEEDQECSRRKRCHQLEIYFGPFQRVIRISDKVRIDRDGIQAQYRDGFLTVTLPKITRPEPASTEIRVDFTE
ncbi:MAG: Hsp20/alpha crystallin family protein [Armatimonadetes bacterium]|nr:Hsp20/alpha crystallin family protein [Armatimonadota bacterium]